MLLTMGGTGVKLSALEPSFVCLIDEHLMKRSPGTKRGLAHKVRSHQSASGTLMNRADRLHRLRFIWPHQSVNACLGVCAGVLGTLKQSAARLASARVPEKTADVFLEPSHVRCNLLSAGLSLPAFSLLNDNKSPLPARGRVRKTRKNGSFARPTAFQSTKFLEAKAIQAISRTNKETASTDGISRH